MSDKLPSKEEYFAELIGKALVKALTQGTSDLPHRFKAPSSMRQYMEDYGTNSSMYHQVPIGYGHSPLMLQITTRPTQKILEMIFQGPDGMRLFTLEIEYGSDT